MLTPFDEYHSQPYHSSDLALPRTRGPYDNLVRSIR